MLTRFALDASSLGLKRVRELSYVSGGKKGVADTSPVFVLGGEEIYREAMKTSGCATHQVLTHLGKSYKGDRFYPLDFDKDLWRETGERSPFQVRLACRLSAACAATDTHPDFRWLCREI